MAFGTSYNTRLTLRRHTAAPGFRSARSFRCAPFPRLPPPTFCQPWSLLRKALIRAGKTSSTFNVMRQFCRIFWITQIRLLSTFPIYPLTLIFCFIPLRLLSTCLICPTTLKFGFTPARFLATCLIPPATLIFWFTPLLRPFAICLICPLISNFWFTPLNLCSTYLICLPTLKFGFTPLRLFATYPIRLATLIFDLLH